jgi:hypothetical protein
MSFSLSVQQGRTIWSAAMRAERAAFVVMTLLGVTSVVLAVVGARNVATVLLCLLWAAVHFGAAWLVVLNSIDRAIQHEATSQYLARAGGDHVLDGDGGVSLRFTAERGWRDAA